MFKIYKGDSVVVEGESPLSITGLAPDTQVAEGEYEVVRVEDDKESNRVDIPAFKTLPIDAESVTLSPKTSTADAGEAGERQLSAEVSPSNATNKGVTYSIDNQDGLTVSNSGKIEWTADVPEGEYTTTVTTDDGSHTDTHVLTLEEQEEEEPEEPDPQEDDDNLPESIEISPTEHTFIDIWEPGTSKRFNVTILPEDVDQEFTVESSDESIVRASIDGTQAVGMAMESGTAILTVKTVNGLTATATINVPEQD